MTETAPKTIPLPGAAAQFAQQELRVAAYCRTSDDETELETQKSYYTSMIAANPNWTLAGIFADVGPQRTKRPEFQKLLCKCRQQKVDMILVRATSRFCRSLADLWKSLQILRELGVTVVFETENINTANRDSDILQMTMRVFAEIACQNITRNSVYKPHMWSANKKQIKGGGNTHDRNNP